MEALITRDELIGEGQTRHEPTLLQPEDGTERAREKDALHTGKSNQALIKVLGAARKTRGEWSAVLSCISRTCMNWFVGRCSIRE